MAWSETQQGMGKGSQSGKHLSPLDPHYSWNPADIKSGGLTEFAGVVVDETTVLAAYTPWGDANLDRVVTRTTTT